MEADDPDWKMKLRSGRISTPFRHYFGIADGTVGALKHGFSCPEGPAIMGMKMWASSTDEAVDMMRSIGADIGFTLHGRIQVYDAEPSRPPGDSPLGYDIQFTPYSIDVDEDR